MRPTRNTAAEPRCPAVNSFRLFFNFVRKIGGFDRRRCSEGRPQSRGVPSSRVLRGRSTFRFDVCLSRDSVTSPPLWQLRREIASDVIMLSFIFIFSVTFLFFADVRGNQNSSDGRNWIWLPSGDVIIIIFLFNVFLLRFLSPEKSILPFSRGLVQ